MKKKKISIIVSLMLVTAMLMSACADLSADDDTTESSTSPTTESKTETETKATDSTTETASSTESEGASDTADSTEETESESDTEISLEGPFGSSILYANEIKNGVQAYYPNGDKRDSYRVENLNMAAEFGLYANSDSKLTYLKNKQGGTYLENTMDVFVRMKDGKTYYASDSDVNARMNIYRIGYYYYDVRLLNQSFYSSANVEKEFPVDINNFDNPSTHVESVTIQDGVLKYVVGGGIDPYVRIDNDVLSFSMDEYNAVSFSVRTDSASSVQMFVKTSELGYNNGRTKSIEIINDGEWHTYRIMLNEVPEIKGTVTGLRFDAGYFAGETVEIKDIKIQKLDSSAPYIFLDRTLHSYSDKLHQELHFVAPSGQQSIDALGMITTIPADKVEKLIVKDGKALHDKLDKVDWESAEYVGFDIKDAGIFGYIMPYDDKSGSISVTLKDGVYTIVQEATPENNEILSPFDTRGTDNDFFMGQRLYTDESHDFSVFLKEAEWERHPISSIRSDSYLGYDALRGAYHFKINGTGFNNAYYSSWNTHYSTKAIIKNLDEDRKIYVRSITDSGSLENAVLLNEDGLVIPIPLEVSKNFAGENEEFIMNYGDTAFGETVFPLVSSKNSQLSLNILNVYQNWGLFPIRQLSSVGYYAPYYHLSSGVTETSCISPWYVRGRTLWTLPDFRSLSSPLWADQPQHTSSNVPQILHYRNSDGELVFGENVKNVIESSGPIYAEVKMDYVTDDGKMKISYNHIEMPQTDELRAYYEVRIDVLDDISINNFKNDFIFYRFLPSSLPYKIGYVNKNNKISREKADPNDDRSEFVLGKEAPFFSGYDLRTATGAAATNAVNIGFLIHSSNITIGGEKFDGNFIVIEETDRDYCLSLDLEKVTLKAGDSINFNIIITPWGSHLSSDITNLIDMRENSILDPYKLEAIDGEVIESTYMPKLKSVNGKSAEFTISGGANNAAVRVYGFNKLTAPKIYEKIDGKWVEYEVCSINSPDNTKAKNYYDGYFTYYDGDGTYSYAFVINMDDMESRTFKVIADHEFEPWPEVVIENDDPINLYFDPAEIAAMLASGIPGIGSATLSDMADYIRITGDGKGKNSEVPLTIYSATNTLATGKYIVLKYRMPSTNAETNHFEFFVSTVNSSANGTDSIDLLNSLTYKKDDQWHLLVIDASQHLPSSFIAADDEQYYCQYIRFDVFNTKMSEESYVDIAYVGMCDSLDKIRELNSDMEQLLLCNTRSSVQTIDIKTGNVVTNPGVTPPKPVVDDGVTVEKNGASFIAADNAQGYTLSDVPYITRVDSINGYGPGNVTGAAFNNRGSSSTNGVATFKFDSVTTDDMAIVISGWGLIHGNAEKYVWSADGGKTWHDVKLRGRSSLSTANATMINYANTICGRTDFEQYAAKSSYQGPIQGPASATGISADLSAYKGQTVNVTFAAVPASDNDTLCIMAHITGVKVEEKVEVEAENPYNDPINFLMTADELYEAFGNKTVSGIGSITLSDGADYVTITGSGTDTPEAILNIFTNPGNVSTGQYVILKYRISSTNEKADYLHFYTSTVNKGVTGTDYIQYWIPKTELDDQWHVIVFDATSFIPENFIEKNGKYYASHLRFDVFNMKRSANDKIDIAYVGISDSIEDIRTLNSDMETLKLCFMGDKVNTCKVQYVNVKTGDITDSVS